MAHASALAAGLCISPIVRPHSCPARRGSSMTASTSLPAAPRGSTSSFSEAPNVPAAAPPPPPLEPRPPAPLLTAPALAPHQAVVAAAPFPSAAGPSPWSSVPVPQPLTAAAAAAATPAAPAPQPPQAAGAAPAPMHGGYAGPSWQCVWTTDPSEHGGLPVESLCYLPSVAGLPGGDGHAGWLVSSSKVGWGGGVGGWVNVWWWLVSSSKVGWWCWWCVRVCTCVHPSGWLGAGLRGQRPPCCCSAMQGPTSA